MDAAGRSTPNPLRAAQTLCTLPSVRPRTKANRSPAWEPPSGRSVLDRIQASLATLQRLQPAPQVHGKPREPIRQEQLNVKRH